MAPLNGKRETAPYLVPVNKLVPNPFLTALARSLGSLFASHLDLEAVEIRVPPLRQKLLKLLRCRVDPHVDAQAHQSSRQRLEELFREPDWLIDPLVMSRRHNLEDFKLGMVRKDVRDVFEMVGWGEAEEGQHE